MCQILSKYREFLLPIRQRPSTGATDLKMLFNVDGFVKLEFFEWRKTNFEKLKLFLFPMQIFITLEQRNAGASKTGNTFYQLLTQSQAFCSFIESRTFSSGQISIQQHEFFDQCQEAVESQLERNSFYMKNQINKSEIYK